MAMMKWIGRFQQYFCFRETQQRLVLLSRKYCMYGIGYTGYMAVNKRKVYINPGPKHKGLRVEISLALGFRLQSIIDLVDVVI